MRKPAARVFGISAALFILAGCEAEPALVVDRADLFDATERERLALFHRLLLADHAIDYRVLTIASAPDLDAFANQRYAGLNVGAASPHGHGLLLVVEAGGQRVRLEVGYGLEGYYPDAFVAYVENRQMLPFFAANRVADGILATTELIVDRAQRYALGKGGQPEAWLDGSGGGGATARLGTAAPKPGTAGAREAAPAGRSPEDTLAGYFDAMQRRDANPELPLYSPQTQAMLRGWVMTPAQMDNVVSTYRSCKASEIRFDRERSLAVIRYPVSQRKCAPWFFQRAGEVWQLDLTMMSRALRFGRDNSWHFDRSVEHDYGFAFDDWRFNANGFPVK